MNYIEEYYAAIVSGDVVVSDKVRRTFRHLVTKLNAPDLKYEFREKDALFVIDFIEKFCCHSKGKWAGQPVRLELWQKALISALFGFKDKETGLRQYRELILMIGRKNGKSLLASALGVYLLVADGEGGPEIYSVATKKDQAKIIWSEAVRMIEHSPDLRQHAKCLVSKIRTKFNNGTFEPLGSDSTKLDGLNPHGAIFDEIHEYRDFKLLNIFKRKTVKRKQPLVIYITTMGNVIDGPLAYYYDLFADAMAGKLMPEVGDRMFAYMAELDSGDDVDDVRTWIKANPGLGRTLHLEELEKQWARCKQIPSERADFICKQLNIMVNADDMAFVQPEVIKRNTGEIDPESLLGRRCYGGFDLSNREDFTAAALEFPLDDGRVFVLLHSWVPQRKVNQDAEKIDYYGLQMRGYLTIVPGEYIQQEDVYNWFAEQAKKYEIVTIGTNYYTAPYLVEAYHPTNTVNALKRVTGNRLRSSSRMPGT